MTSPRSSVWFATVAVLFGILLAPRTVSAQSSGIAGLVRDTSGAVLPGVTVEATSPALIEKVRTVFSDQEGRYNVVDLRPGTYTVTFTLPGFGTVVREGIELTSGFTATVNADLRVGGVEETVTVTGAAPTVDVQNVRQQKVLSDELIKTLPSGANGLMGLTKLIPGMSGGSESGGAAGIYSSNVAWTASIHGKGGFKLSYDGMQTTNFGGTGAMSYVINPSTVEEVQVETGGISAENNASGGAMNMIPKEGGNVFRYGMSGTFTDRHFQSDNLSDTLRDRGLTSTSKVLNLYDFNATVGGPIKRDALWFFTATRFSGNRNQVADVYFNSTRGTPFYTPDLDRPAFRKEWLRSQGARLTWQASPRNKINAFADVQQYEVRGRGGPQAPEAQTCWSFWPVGVYQISWNSPRTSRFLLEAGASLTRNLFPCTREEVTDIFDFTVSETDISILEASTDFRYNAAQSYPPINDQDRYVERFAASYVTGSHTFKAGIQLQQHVLNRDTVVNQDVNYTFLKGVPTTITQWATPYRAFERTKAELGLYAQDQWAIRRLTFNYGLRLDYFNGYVKRQSVPAGRFVGAREFEPVHGVPEWTDLNPRVGASYNLFGNGRTAIKSSLGRYVGRMAVNVATANNPLVTSVNSVNRAWADSNRDYVPDCDLSNFNANGECGAISNANFGKLNPNATRYSDDLIRGVGTRDYFWDFAAEVQHEVNAKLSVNVGYYRNWTDQFGGAGATNTTAAAIWNVGVTDNLAVTPDDFEAYCITAPSDPRLPGGGGYPVCGLYDVVPSKFGRGELLITRASNYGNGKSRQSNFFSAGFTSRRGNGTEFGGSLDTGRLVTDTCFVVDSPQQLLNCRVVAPFKAQTQIKMYANYPLPGAFIVSGTFQNLSGLPYEANLQVPNALIAPSLGRNLAACGSRPACTATATVPLIAPMTQFEPRRTLVDLRLSRVFSMGAKMRLRANLDAYNVLNDSSVVEINSTYGARWRHPLASPSTGGLMDGRLVQIGGQLDF